MEKLNRLKASREIKKLFYEDKRDRASKEFRKLSGKERMEIIAKHDGDRVRKLEQQILQNSPRLTGIDYFRAGLIFQHGPSISFIKRARDMALEGIKLNHSPSQWLYAAATDRILMLEGKKQKFGTQFTKKDDKWILYQVDSSTTDAERVKSNVVPMLRILEILKEFNENPRKRKFTKSIGLTRLQ